MAHGDDGHERALQLISLAMESNNVVTLGGKFTTDDGREMGVILFTLPSHLNGAGLSHMLDTGIYGYGKEDSGFYRISDITVWKAADAAGDLQEDPYPGVGTVWTVGTPEPVLMTTDDGSEEAVTFTRVLSALAISCAKAEGRDEDARVVQEFYEVSAAEDGLVPKALMRSDGPTLTKVKPRIHYWPNAKDSNTLTDPELFDAGGLTLDVGRRKGQTFINFALSMDEGAGSSSIDIDATDRQIISAVSTLKEAARRETGEPVISAYNICEAMGLKHPDAEARAEVDSRMNRLMGTVARIDFSDEARKRKLVNPETGLPYEVAIITRHLVEAQRFEGVDTGGNRYVRYRLLADPPTHEHAKAIRQEVTWPQRLNELPAVKPDGRTYKRSSTGRQLAIKHEILARTYSLRSKKSNQSDTILYDTLCRAVGVDPKNRSAKKGVVDFAEGYLRALENEGVIMDFQPFKRGSSQKKVGVRLFVQQQ